ncbi:MAG: hypothetical protein HKN25_02065 [Pyrinomonadaceae bacterium]|nr:hypothetical protein [Pyrinomonadaceae bacterium]
MQNEIIQKVAVLMTEQTENYVELKDMTEQLSQALIAGEPVKIETLTRSGESKLLRMRSRLVEIASSLTSFAESRAAQETKTPLEESVREQFEDAAEQLLELAREFQILAKKASDLALAGSSFATACIQTCGLPPTTYSAPVLRDPEGVKKWA